MANSAYVSVTTSATALNTASTQAGATYTPDTVIVKVPAGGATVYIGGAAVTADTTAGTGGFPVAAGESLSVPVGAEEVIYGIVEQSTQSVNVLRAGV